MEPIVEYNGLRYGRNGRKQRWLRHAIAITASDDGWYGLRIRTRKRCWRLPYDVATALTATNASVLALRNDVQPTTTSSATAWHGNEHADGRSSKLHATAAASDGQ